MMKQETKLIVKDNFINSEVEHIELAISFP